MAELTIVFRVRSQFVPVLLIAELPVGDGTRAPMVERAFRTPDVDGETIAPLDRVCTVPAIDRESLAVLDR